MKLWLGWAECALGIDARGRTNHMPTHVLAVADSGTTALRSKARIRLSSRATGGRLKMQHRCVATPRPPANARSGDTNGT